MIPLTCKYWAYI